MPSHQRDFYLNPEPVQDYKLVDGVEIETGEFDYDISGLDCEEFGFGLTVEQLLNNYLWNGR